jgi:hypothetical protein
MLAGIAMTEPSVGSDLKAMRTRAQRDGEHYVINGSKTFITNGFTANLLVVAAHRRCGQRRRIAGGAGDGKPARLSRGPQAGKDRPAYFGHSRAVL